MNSSLQETYLYIHIEYVIALNYECNLVYLLESAIERSLIMMTMVMPY